MEININGKEINLNQGEYKLRVWKDYFEIHDKNDEIIYHENSSGYWQRWTRNEDGYIIYFENSNGNWRKYTRDDNGNPTSYVNSDGFWFKKEYDENNYIVYQEDSNRGIIIDKRNKTVEVSMDDIAEKFGVDVKNLKIKKKIILVWN